MKFLVTGGCGFIGANLVGYLLKKGHAVKVFDNLSVGSRKNLENACKKFNVPEIIVEDVRDLEAVEEAVNGMDAVVHLAAHTNVVGSLEKPEEDFQINAIGTFNVLEACRKNSVNRVVYASSNAAVGEQDPPINEEKIPAPLSPYGASKLAGEALCSAYYNSYGINTVSLRFSNVYGPYSSHKTSVIAKFIRRVKEETPIVIYGDGNQTRDFVHVRDICEAIYLALNSDSGGEVFQIGTGVETRIRDLAYKLSKLDVASGFKKQEVVYTDAQRGEIMKNFSDISKSKNLLGFKPKINFDRGLKEVFRDYF